MVAMFNGVTLFARLRRELPEQRIKIESFLVLLGVSLVLYAIELFYFAWQKQLIAQGGRVHYPETALDAYIPFVPELIWPYWGYFGLIAFSVWLPKNRHELARQVGGLAFVHMIGFACYFMYPSAMHRAVDLCDSISCNMVGAIYLLDPGFGVFPSLHVAVSLYMALASFAFAHPARWFVALFALSIVAATVLVKQHYVIDVPAGAIVGLLGWRVSWSFIDWAGERLKQNRISVFGLDTSAD